VAAFPKLAPAERTVDGRWLGSIAEFGAGSGDYSAVSNDLRLWAESRRKGNCTYEQKLLATLGPVDVVEIALFRRFEHLFKLGRSSAQALRRASGILCPAAGDLPPRAMRSPHVRLVEEILRPDATRPFWGVLYAQISPLLTLFLPPNIDDPLLIDLLSKVADSAAPLWQHKHAIEEQMGSTASDEVPTLAAPAAGLGAAEVVVVVRGRTLLEVVALAWAARAQKIGHYWPAREHEVAIEQASAFVQDSARASLATSWDNSRVFRDVGLRLGFGVDHAGNDAASPWRLDELADDASGGACPGVAVVTCRSWIRAAAEGGGARDSDGRTAGVLALADATGFLRFVGREDDRHFDIAQLRAEIQATLETPAAGSRERERWLSSDDVRRSTSTDVAIPIPEALRSMLAPSQTLLGLIRARLREERAKHLDRGRGGWLSSWYVGMRTLGTPYALTDSVASLVCAVLEYLEDEVDALADVLPAISTLGALGSRAGPAADRQSEIRELHAALEKLVRIRSQRDDPLRLLKTSLAFEVHAGYALPSAAASALAEAAGHALGYQGCLLLVDSAWATMRCVPRKSGWAAIETSTMALREPTCWAYAHEVAHARLAEVTVGALGLEAQARQLLAPVGTRARVADRTVSSVLGEWGQWLTVEGGRSANPLLWSTIAELAEEVAADLLLWKSLAVRGQPAEEIFRRFWLVLGPTIVYANQHERGVDDASYVDTSISVAHFVVRFCLLNNVLASAEGLPGAADWFEELDTLAAALVEQADQLSRNTQPSLCNREVVLAHAGETHAHPDARRLKLFHFLMTDLGVDSEMWRAGMMALDLSVGHAASSRTAVPAPRAQDPADAASARSGWLGESVSAWAEFIAKACGALWTGGDAQDQAALETYSNYLGDLLSQGGWPEPWPPFIERHEWDERIASDPRAAGGDSSVVLSRRGGVLAFDIQSRQRVEQASYAGATSELWVKLFECFRRRRCTKLREYLRWPTQAAADRSSPGL
jgi:hypothetical protein